MITPFSVGRPVLEQEGGESVFCFNGSIIYISCPNPFGINNSYDDDSTYL